MIMFKRKKSRKELENQLKIQMGNNKILNDLKKRIK